MTGYICLILTLIFTALGQLCQKQAALGLSDLSNASMSSSLSSSSSLSTNLPLPKRISHYKKWLFAAILCLSLGMLNWLIVLALLPLSIAYPMMSLNFVIIAASSRWLYQETINSTQMIGIFLITFGVGLLAH